MNWMNHVRLRLGVRLMFGAYVLFYVCNYSNNPMMKMEELIEPGVRKIMAPLDQTDAPAIHVLMPKFCSAGVNNFKMEIRRAAVMAHELGRSLCVPIIEPSYRASANSFTAGLRLDDLYDISELSKFVPILPESECTAVGENPSVTLRCEEKNWNHDSIQLEKKHNEQEYSQVPLISLHSCLMPNRPDHDDVALWKHLKSPPKVRNYADQVISQLSSAERNKIGLSSLKQTSKDFPFVSFHWRFEEDKCARVPVEEKLGLCMRTNGFLGSGNSGTLVATPDEIVTVLVDKAKSKETVFPIFLATDGRMRGFGKTVDTVKKLVQDKHGVPIYELEDLLSMADVEDELFAMSQTPFLRNEVEQTICKKSSHHIGSGISSWDWEIYLTKAINHKDYDTWFRLAHALENFYNAKSSCSNVTHGMDGLMMQRWATELESPGSDGAYFSLTDMDITLLREIGIESFLSRENDMDADFARELMKNMNIGTEPC